MSDKTLLLCCHFFGDCNQIAHRFLDGLRCDSMFLIVRLLKLPAALCLLNGARAWNP